MKQGLTYLNYPIITKETYGGDIPKVMANKKFS